MDIVMPEETPVNKAPILDCENSPSCGTWVRHTYAGREVEGPHGDTESLMFACDRCGRKRVFGREKCARKASWLR